MKDPAVLWYWNDWGGGTRTLSRHLKGCYMDLLEAQFNSGHLSLEEIRTVLGQDQATWTVLSKKFKQDENGLFYNERLETEKIKRSAYSESRSKNRKKKSDESENEHMNNHMLNHMSPHMENENENINRIIEKGVKGEKPKEEKTDFIEQIINCFSEKYLEYRGVNYFVSNKGAERSCAGKLLNLYRNKNPNSDSEKTMIDLEQFFENCLLITDPWLNQNMSIPIVLSKMNQILNILKNGNNKQKSQPATSDSELAGVIAKHFATDYPKG